MVVVCNGSYIIPEMIFLGGSEYRFIFLLKWYLVMRNIFLVEFSWLLVTSPCSSLALSTSASLEVKDAAAMAGESLCQLMPLLGCHSH